MEAITRYIFEAGMLKRVARSGWWSEGVKSAESVADHSHRTAVIAFILAKLEGLDDDSARRICTAAVFHDMHETRILDLNKIAARYIHVDHELERKVEMEQAEGIEAKVKKSLLAALELSDEERIILKDADQLECAFQAKEYAGIGYPTARWITRIKTRLRTRSAKALASKLERAEPGAWKEGLRRFD